MHSMLTGVSMVDVKESFLGGFLVLGFALFLVGFLTGLLAFALMPSELDVTVEFMIFILGFLLGIVAIALALMVKRSTKLMKKPS